MRKYLMLFAVVVIAQACNQPVANTTTSSKTHADTVVDSNDSGNLKKYFLTTIQDTFNRATEKLVANNVTENVRSLNDTTAYFAALKKFYNQKVVERQNYNYGQPKSFVIVDENGIDLKVKLPERIVVGLTKQVENMPDIKKMLEEYQRDSLPH